MVIYTCSNTDYMVQPCMNDFPSATTITYITPNAQFIEHHRCTKNNHKLRQRGFQLHEQRGRGMFCCFGPEESGMGSVDEGWRYSQGHSTGAGAAL
jgi:hypothetical protein